MKDVSTNKKAFFDYSFTEKIEAGICLLGTEVKSIRVNGCNLTDSYAYFFSGELLLCNVDIPQYSMGNINNHEPKRKRKLLLKRRELHRCQKVISEKGCTILPIRVYLKNGLVKVELAFAKGKKQIDKREVIKQKESNKDILRAIKSKN